jgi:hypothetical protein
MTRITLNIHDDSKLAFFRDLIKNLDFVSISEEEEKKLTKSEKKTLERIEKGLKEVQLIEQGKMKSTPLKDFLDEL